jgi:DNA-binding transcriptional ArsR family regulator
MTDERAQPYGPDPVTDVVLDAKGLRALAHPVRVQLIGLLRTYGPSTATRLAERMGLTSGATSYHLRQLAAAVLVEEDVERGNARERWWRSVHRTTWFNDIDLAEREPEAAMTFLQSVVATYTLRTQRALNELQTMPREWREVFDISDCSLWLTPEETGSLQNGLRSVVARYRRNTPEEAVGAPAGAARVSLITHVLPEPDASAAAATEPGPEARTGRP